MSSWIHSWLAPSLPTSEDGNLFFCRKPASFLIHLWFDILTCGRYCFGHGIFSKNNIILYSAIYILHLLYIYYNYNWIMTTKLLLMRPWTNLNVLGKGNWSEWFNFCWFVLVPLTNFSKFFLKLQMILSLWWKKGNLILMFIMNLILKKL